MRRQEPSARRIALGVADRCGQVRSLAHVDALLVDADRTPTLLRVTS